jgi:hypothetical protein
MRNTVVAPVPYLRISGLSCVEMVTGPGPVTIPPGHISMTRVVDRGHGRPIGASPSEGPDVAGAGRCWGRGSRVDVAGWSREAVTQR